MPPPLTGRSCGGLVIKTLPGHVPERQKGNTTIEMLNENLNPQSGFTPGAVVPAMRNPQDRYFVIIAQRRSGIGDRHCPSFIIPE